MLARHYPILLLLFACVACQPRDEITTYSTERTTPPRPPFNAAKVADQLDRTLAAMLPIDETVWFFKLAGPAVAVAQHRDAFMSFLESVKQGTTEAEPLSWELPKGWSEKGPSDMRLATIVIPHEPQELEIAISSLPLSGAWEDFVTLNVNRWLGQLSQGDLAKPTILKQTTKVNTGAGEATTIELAGILKKSPAMNPHAGMVAQAAPASPSESAPKAAEPASEVGFTFETPKDWRPGKTSAMRKAAFDVGSDGKQAEVTVIPLPTSAGPQITDVQANVQRWAAQVGLPPETKLEQFIEKIEIDGNRGSFIRLESPAEKSPRVAMLVAMVEHGEKVWFFKMTGDPELIDQQQGTFRDFLTSVSFE